MKELQDFFSDVNISRIQFLVGWLWGDIPAARNITYYQAYIIKRIVFDNVNRISISAYTRYGKSQTIAIAVALYILLNENKKIKFIGPTDDQAGIIKDYMSELIIRCRSGILLSIAEIQATGPQRLKAEASARRLTFTNGCEYRVVTAHGKGFAAMGHGGDLCVPSGTLIKTNKGDLDIKDIVRRNIDCKVLSYNHKNHKLEFKDIVCRFDNGNKDLIKISHSKGFFQCTPNHPIYVKGKGYIEAKYLRGEEKIYISYGKLNLYDYKMRDLWKRILHKTQPLQKNKRSFLFKGMFFKESKRKFKSSMEWWKKKVNLQKLWEIFLCKTKGIRKKNLLQCKLQSRRYKEKTKKKNKKDLFNLWKTVQSYSCKKRGNVLFHKLFKQKPCKKYEGRRKSCLAGWDTIRGLWQRVQYRFKKKNKKKISKPMFFMQGEKYSTSSSYRLQQKKQQRNKFGSFMRKLSFKNKLSSGFLEEVSVKQVEKLNFKKEVYNLEVKDNNNYFANSVLVHNCIMDEAAMISKESYAKITRMLGDDPENATLVELFNPWDRDTKAFDHSISSRFERIQIDWRVGLQEGRTTQEHIDEMRDEITPLEFTVLYESCFPEETEDSLHSLKDIRHAEQLEFNLEEEYNEIIIELQALEKKKNTLRENEFLTKKNALMKEKSRFVKIISCDPADKGLDFTVIKWGICKDMMLYEPIGIYSEPKTDPMNLVGRLMDKFREYVGFDKEMGKLNCNCLMELDCIGIGTGPVSRLRERKQEEEIDSLRIISCHNGEAPSDQPKSKNRKRSAYLNKKAENNFRLQRLFKARQVALKKLSADPEYDKLSKELSIMKWDLTSNEKKKIIDPDKSPDYNDALVYFIWKDKKSLAYDFL